jgi:hypothetical protein
MTQKKTFHTKKVYFKNSKSYVINIYFSNEVLVVLD